MKHILLNVSVLCLLFAGCQTPLEKLPLETHFEWQKAHLIEEALEYDQPACRSSSLTAFKDRERVLMIEFRLGTSQRSLIRNFYFRDNKLQLVKQRTWWLLDAQAYELETSKLESETRFYFSGIQLQRMEGDDPPIHCDPKELLEQASTFLKLAIDKTSNPPANNVLLY